VNQLELYQLCWNVRCSPSYMVCLIYIAGRASQICFLLSQVCSFAIYVMEKNLLLSFIKVIPHPQCCVKEKHSRTPTDDLYETQALYTLQYENFVNGYVTKSNRNIQLLLENIIVILHLNLIPKKVCLQFMLCVFYIYFIRHKDKT